MKNKNFNIKIIKENAIKEIINNKKLVFDIAEKIWNYKELSLEEYKSSKLYIETLKKAGFDVKTNFAGIKTAFLGKFGRGKPVIGILAEYDALNGIGHGCGHNLLGAGSLAAALSLKKVLNKGTILFYGCPGEEAAASKSYYVKDNLFKNVDAVITWHPNDSSQVNTGSTNAVIQTEYTFIGKSAHAAKCPEKGRSALDAVEIMNIGVQFLREHMDEKARIHYAITDAGGVSPNVVQDIAKVTYMVRSPLIKDAMTLQKRVDKIAKGAALITETKFTKKFLDANSNFLPSQSLSKIMYTNAIKILKNIKPLDKSAEFRASSTDVGDVSQVVPTIEAYVKTWSTGTEMHTKKSAIESNSLFAKNSMLDASKIIATTAIDLIYDEKYLIEAKKEFKKRKKFISPIPKNAKLICK